MITENFDIDATNSCKGVALILLLWHHLFYETSEYGAVTHQFAILSNVCVAIFVILSGYGFSESFKRKKINYIGFYRKRLVTLFLNYWFIAMIFVPLGILFFERPLSEVYTSHHHVKFVIQMLGLHRFAYYEYGYNATWWYISAFLALTILFPFIYNSVKKYPIITGLLFFGILLPNRSYIPVINTWLLPFSLGIFYSQRNVLEKTSKFLKKTGKLRYLLLFFAIFLSTVLGQNLFFITPIEADWLPGSIIILFIYELVVVYNALKLLLIFLGEHLFNIFLFHTFIYKYYFENFIYSFNNPIIIFIVLLVICILISVLIEKVKNIIHFKGIQRYLAVGRNSRNTCRTAA